jgi:TetR/AcrR family transcriptional regulator, mexJK operon transcriptional repressor
LPHSASRPRSAAASWSRSADPATIGRTTIATSDHPRTGGRPTAAQAAELATRILDAAAGLFLEDGFAATSIEAIAAAAGVSKRTLYARFTGKEAVFLAVVQRLVGTWLVGFDAALEEAPSLEAALLTAARRMMAVALTPTAIALHRLVVAEAGRFPELAAALRVGGARAGIERLCRVLHAHHPEVGSPRVAFLAEQFQHLVLAGPQARAMGLGEHLDPNALEAWCRDSVTLFLQGLRSVSER